MQLSGKIAFASGKTGDYDIWTFDADTGELRQMTTGTDWNDRPAWSPCGQWIAFTSGRTGYQELFKVNVADPSQIVQLTELKRWCDAPRFSPDGSQIAYISNESGNNDVWVMDADGGNRSQRTTHEGNDTHVEWTRDGHGLLWSSDRGDQGDQAGEVAARNADIWHLDFATEQKTQLTNDSGVDNQPVQSPCGELIAFVSNRAVDAIEGKPYTDRDRDIWLMSMTGEFQVRLTTNQGSDFCVCWSPDGTKLLYAASNDKTATRLRILDVEDVASAIREGDQPRLYKAVRALRSEEVALDREPLQNEVGAQRHTTVLTHWMPDSWVKGWYPAEHFGQERHPHWIGDATFSA